MMSDRTLQNPRSSVILYFPPRGKAPERCEIVRLNGTGKITCRRQVLHTADFICGSDGFIFKNRYGNTGWPVRVDSDTSNALFQCMSHWASKLTKSP